MLPQPPPDEPCDEFAISLDQVYVRTLGKGDGRTVEVLANEGPRYYRFDMPLHARVIRKFWRENGVKDPSRFEGVIEASVGYGPLTMSGVVIGHDLNPTATDGDEKTYVLRAVELRS